MSDLTTNYCTGRGTADGGHCCYVAGQECKWLERGTVEGRRYVCGLRRRLGSWEAVHAHSDYQPIQAEWDRVGISSCGDWQPPPNQCCREVLAVE